MKIKSIRLILLLVGMIFCTVVRTSISFADTQSTDNQPPKCIYQLPSQYNQLPTPQTPSDVQLIYQPANSNITFASTPCPILANAQGFSIYFTSKSGLINTKNNYTVAFSNSQADPTKVYSSSDMTGDSFSTSIGYDPSGDMTRVSSNPNIIGVRVNISQAGFNTVQGGFYTFVLYAGSIGDPISAYNILFVGQIFIHSQCDRTIGCPSFGVPQTSFGGTDNHIANIKFLNIQPTQKYTFWWETDTGDTHTIFSNNLANVTGMQKLANHPNGAEDFQLNSLDISNLIGKVRLCMTMGKITSFLGVISFGTFDLSCTYYVDITRSAGAAPKTTPGYTFSNPTGAPLEVPTIGPNSSQLLPCIGGTGIINATPTPTKSPVSEKTNSNNAFASIGAKLSNSWNNVLADATFFFTGVAPATPSQFSNQQVAYAPNASSQNTAEFVSNPSTQNQNTSTSSDFEAYPTNLEYMSPADGQLTIIFNAKRTDGYVLSASVLNAKTNQQASLITYESFSCPTTNSSCTHTVPLSSFNNIDIPYNSSETVTLALKNTNDPSIALATTITATGYINCGDGTLCYNGQVCSTNSTAHPGGATTTYSCVNPSPTPTIALQGAPQFGNTCQQACSSVPAGLQSTCNNLCTTTTGTQQSNAIACMVQNCKNISDQTQLTACAQSCISIDSTSAILPTTSPTPCEIQTAIGPINTDPFAFVQRLFGIFLSISGGIALILIMYHGYQLMISSGNPDKVKKAKEGLTSGIIGIIFAILSIAILQTIGVDILHLPGFSN